MMYIDSEYRLRQLTPGAFREVSVSQGAKPKHALQVISLESMVEKLVQHEDAFLKEHVLGYGKHLAESFRKSEAETYYSIAFGVGFCALRASNPQPAVPRIQENDWIRTIEHEKQLGHEVRSFSELAFKGLQEINTVNKNLYLAFRQWGESNNTPEAMMPYTMLGTIHAHDVLHFASLRSTNTPSN